MSGFPLRCILLLCLSVLVVLHHSVEAWVEDPKWEEPHDEIYRQHVAVNQQLLTKEGREIGHSMGIRKLRLEEESNHQNSNRIRGRGQRGLTANPNVSQLNVLVVLLQWTNHPERNTAMPRESYDKLFNGQGRDADLYPGGSVKEYFETMSYGELSINFEVTDWIMTDYTEQQFTLDGSQGRSQELQNAFKPALDSLDDDCFDFRSFDSNFDYLLDLTVFLHSGYDGSIGATECENGIKNTQRIASHARTGALASPWLSLAGYRLGPYAVSFFLGKGKLTDIFCGDATNYFVPLCSEVLDDC